MTKTAGSAEQVDLVQRLCRRIESAEDAPPSLTELARWAGLSPAHLQRVFKRLVGVSPRQYADAHRLGRLKERLKKGDDVTTALYEAGYGSSSRLYERAASQLGMTPGAYRNGGRAVEIGYTLLTTPLGRLLLAATERGVCMVSLGDADAPLETALREEFPQAALHRDDERLGKWAAALREHLNGDRPHLDLPLDVQATAFQRRVWQELCAIPYGQTRSYADVARQLGQPTAARAVARACATNPVSLLVPCHRVVRGDGGLGGYRWGLKRKQALLEREKEGPTTKQSDGGT
jgi:AraC family transcriptional regulator of adaptative response/methylated-DNA-[protein]-cysteine methyltransferase